MSGWSGAISAIVRAIATAVSGSFDGVLMIASLRVIAIAGSSPPRHGAVAGGDVERPRAERADPQAPAVDQLSAPPSPRGGRCRPGASAISRTNTRVEQRIGRTGRFWQHRRREAGSPERGLVGVLDVRVAVGVERIAQAVEVRRRCRRRRARTGRPWPSGVGERQPVDVVGPGRAHRNWIPPARPPKRHQVVLDQLAPHEQRDGVGPIMTRTPSGSRWPRAGAVGRGAGDAIVVTPCFSL